MLPVDSASTSTSAAGPAHTPLGSAADLRKLLDDLLHCWDHGPEEVQTPRGKPMVEVRAKSIFALTAHAHRLGHAVAVLVDNGFGLETAPTVRTVLECALTAQWMLQYGDDAAYGVAYETQRQRRNVGATIEKATTMMRLDNAQAVLDLIAADQAHVIELRSAAAARARHFEKLCEDFEAGTGYYLAYRMLSSFVHPGPNVFEAYMDSHDPPTFRLDPHPVGKPTTWLFNTCAALVWAARAADCLDGRHTNRSFLRTAAKQLGIPLELQLSGAAFVRREQERQQRKHQKA